MSQPKAEKISEQVSSTQPGLLVLGMHRSGTSCLAGMLECAGFQVGEVDEWNPHNLKGNRENLAAVAINDALLRASGGAWNKVPECERIASHHRADIRRLTDALAASGKPWLVKDPRTLLVLRAWTDTVPSLSKFGIFRHPVPVAQSLRNRDASSLEAAVGLWCAYNERLIAALDRESFPLLLFNGEPEYLNRAVEGGLKQLFQDLVSSGVLDLTKADDFVDPSLVHQAGPVEKDVVETLAALSLPPALIERAQGIWSRLLERQNPVRLEAFDSERTRAPSTVDTVRTTTKRDRDQPIDTIRTIESIDQQIAATTDRIDLFRRGAAIFEKTGDLIGQLRWLEGWCQRLPSDPFLHWELANSYWDGGERNSAIEHAIQAHRLAPTWLTPSLALAQWAIEAERWQLAAEINRSLYTMQFSRAKDRAPAAELFVDSGNGFNQEEAAEQSIFGIGRSVELHFNESTLLRNVMQVRLDPLNQAVVVQDPEVTLHRDDGLTIALEPSGSNAELESEGVFYFTTDDPQIYFALPRAAGSMFVALEARYRITRVGDDVHSELTRRLRQQINELEGSLSWRITAPLRWLCKRFA